MSSKKKNLDEELSDVSSSEESIVNFVKKKDEKQKEEQKEKILSKKTKREKKEESESDSDSISNGNLKYKKIKKEEKKDNSDNDEDDSEEKEEKINFKKNTKIKKDKQEEENSENEKDVQDKKKKKLNNNDHDDKKESDSEQSSQEKEEEKVKPKLKNKPKKEPKEEKESDTDSSNSEKSNNNEKDKEENSEPKLVKNPNKTESKEKESKKPKSYNSGTWPELFVNNLSYKTTDESLKNYFSKYGEVESTKIVYDKETGRPKGVGFCKFCDSSSAAKALEDNDNLFLDGRPIAVSYSNDKKGSAKVRKSKFKGNKEYSGEKFSIFIGNLSFKTNEDGIKNLFEDSMLILIPKKVWKMLLKKVDIF